MQLKNRPKWLLAKLPLPIVALGLLVANLLTDNEQVAAAAYVAAILAMLWVIILTLMEAHFRINDLEKEQAGVLRALNLIAQILTVNTEDIKKCIESIINRQNELFVKQNKHIYELLDLRDALVDALIERKERMNNGKG